MLNITGRTKFSTLPHFPQDTESISAQGLLSRLVSVIKKSSKQDSLRSGQIWCKDNLPAQTRVYTGFLQWRERHVLWRHSIVKQRPRKWMTSQVLINSQIKRKCYLEFHYWLHNFSWQKLARQSTQSWRTTELIKRGIYDNQGKTGSFCYRQPWDS